MPVSILLIEDEEYQRREVVEFLAASGLSCEITEVESLGEAEAKLVEMDFDVVICDMKIPSAMGVADHDKQFGLSAYLSSVEAQPGTPRMFYSAFIDLETVGDHLSQSHVDDLFGDNVERPLTSHVTKGSGALAQCAATVRMIADGLAALGAVAVNGVGAEPPLDRLEVRALQVFARRMEGVVVDAVVLGGYSGARAMAVGIRDQESRLIGNAFGKVGNQAKLDDERARYEKFVANRLPHGSYAPLTGRVDSLLGRRRGIFYALAEQYDENLLGGSQKDDALAGAAVAQIAESMQTWTGASRESELWLGGERSSRVDDARMITFAEGYGLLEMMERVEALRLLTPYGIQHGDLHGENVLIDSSFSPILIDFGDVGEAPLGLDPLTLEMSLLFHPRSPLLNGPWPSTTQLSQWPDTDVYLDGCPCPEFVWACRSWLLDLCGPTAAMGLAWVHTSRQIKYGAVSDHRLSTILNGIGQKLLAI